MRLSVISPDIIMIWPIQSLLTQSTRCVHQYPCWGEEERRRRRRRRRSLFRIAHARGAIPNEMGPTRCRATSVLNHSGDATHTPGGGGGGGGVFSESYTRGSQFPGRRTRGGHAGHTVLHAKESHLVKNRASRDSYKILNKLHLAHV